MFKMAANKARSHLGDKTTSDRLKEFPNDFYIDNRFFMCRACEVAVDHIRKSTVINHLKSAKHCAQKARRSVVSVHIIMSSVTSVTI